MGIFGPSQKEIWSNVAGEINATFVKGGFAKPAKVIARVKEWTITLDTFAVHTGNATVPFTQMRAPFVSKDGFRFRIYRRHFFSAIGKFFGRKEVKVGYEEIDKDFIVQGNDAYKLQKLFANETIRKLIVSQPKIELEIKGKDRSGPKFPANVNMLTFQVSGIIKDGARLKVLFTLFEEVLLQLSEIGVATEKDPRVTLK